MEFPGPYCESMGIHTALIIEKSIPKIDKLTNGIVLELFQYTKQINFTLLEFIQCLADGNHEFKNVNTSSVYTKINKIASQKKSLQHKKKVKGVKNIDDLLARLFVVPSVARNKERLHSESTPTASLFKICATDTTMALHQALPEIQTPTNVNRSAEVAVQTDDLNDQETDSPTKKWNIKRYLCNKQTRKLRKLKKEEASILVTIQQQNTRVGHYSIKNVNKRDETARKNLKLFRSVQRTVARNKIKLNAAEHSMKNVEQQMSIIQEENCKLKEINYSLVDSMQTEKDKKLALQKANSYLKKELHRIRVTENDTESHDECNETIIQMQLKLEEKQIVMDEMAQEIERLKQESSEKCTKNEDGTFKNELRLCVIDLFGLEIGTEKISQAISVVSKHIFHHEFKKNDLPTATSVQNIVDEGHFLAKTYIAEKVAAASTWGISRDGTTRKKRKLVDTSVTLDSGAVISLGFNQVSRETAAAITDVTKNHISELASAHNSINSREDAPRESLDEEYIINTLQKLSFTMSDRASNEKLADKLLSEWRENMLKKCGNEKEIFTVKHFHCMAHVLLGFHSYVCKDMKSVEQKLVEHTGPIGRDSLPVFKTWSNKETAFTRAVRTTSDVFGPVGEYNGLRDRWEAYCSKKGIKSLIGNYRDNRFNGLFQTAAEICVHLDDFLEVIKSVGTPNLKIKAVNADLQSQTIQMSLKGLAQLYVKITGPYWWLVTSGTVTYLELYKYIQSLETYLNMCASDPKRLFDAETDWLKDVDVPHIGIFSRVLKCDEPPAILLEMVATACAAMLKTVQKQLVDFLSGGQFSTSPTKEDMTRTACAHVTNLGCEHHFGDLDSSQRRRPNASIHHHSSVQLIKRNRKQLVKWLGNMPVDVQNHVMKSARKLGPLMRKKHREQETNVHNEIFELMETQPKKKKQKTNSSVRSDEKISENAEDTMKKSLPHNRKFCLNEYVAVAYQDDWYPGVVEKVVDESTAYVRFMARCRKQGHFQWPSRDDKQIVKMDFVLKREFLPECLNSGRQWHIKEHAETDELYQLFDKTFFG